MSTVSNETHGILAEFHTVDEIIAAAKVVRDAGYTKWDCHTPMPVHGLDQAMGVRDTRLPWIVLAAGLTGGGLGILMQWWMNAVDYPYVISGKPDWSLPANIPVAFEMTVLFAAFTAFFSMWILNGLPRWFNPFSRVERFARATDDRFFVAIRADDPMFDPDQTAAMLQQAGAHAVETVAEPDESKTPPVAVRGTLWSVGALSLLPLFLVAMARYSTTDQPRIHLVPDMDVHRALKTQGVTDLFADGRTMRPQVNGTFALEDQEMVGENPAFYTGKQGDAFVTKVPVAVTPELVKRGQQRFNIYCSVCHGANGSGKGMVAQRAVLRSPKTWVAPTDLHSQAVVDQPDGQIFDSISNGVRNMPGYAAQIPYQDRWAIVLYVRALQRSQAASASDIPEGVNLR